MLTFLLGLILIQSNDPIINKLISIPDQTLKRVTTEDGIPNNQTISIVQDYQGFIWVATRTGLGRFDGISFRNYFNDADNPHSLTSNFIERVMTDDDGELWVFTREGSLHSFNRHNDQFERIHEIGQDSPLPRRDIIEVFGTSETGWWIGAWNGLYYLNPDKTELQLIETALNLGYITDYLRKEGEQFIYFTSFRRGVFRFDMETGHITSLEKINRNLAMYATNHITQTKDGHFLIVEHTTINVVSKDGQLISSQNMGGGQIYHVTTDADYNTWFMHGYTIRRYDDKSGEANDYFRIQGALTLYVDPSQVLWIGTGGVNLTGYGLYTFDTKTLRFGFTEKTFNELVTDPLIEHLKKHDMGYENVSDWEILSVKEFDENTTWFLTRRRGIFRLNKKNDTLESYTFQLEQNDPRTPDAHDFVLMDEHTFAISTSRGLVFVDANTGDSSLLPNREVKPDFTDTLAGIVINKMEKIASYYWFASVEFGLFAFNHATGETLSFNHDPTNRLTVGANNITAVSKDPVNPDRYIWVGTNLGGLNRIDLTDNSVIRLHDVSDFNAMVINSIHQDGETGLWLETDRGLIYFDVTTFNFIRYSVFDGIQGTYSYYNRNQNLRRADGSILLCDSNGCNSFFPNAIKPNTQTPSIGITNIKVMNESVLPLSSGWFTNPQNEPASLQVQWNQNIIGVEFASLEFSAPQKNRHKYRVPPFIEDWIDIGHSREITLTNLDPGSYKLEILGSNNDGIWGTEPAVFFIDVIPPFWMTFTFRLLLFFILVSVVGGVVWMVSNRKYKAKLRELEYKLAVDNERMRISRDMHDNLGSRLTQIQLMSRSRTKKKRGEALERTLEEISKETEGIIQNVSQIVWALNPENDTIENLAGFIIQYTETFCQRAQIVCRIKADEEFPEQSVPADKRHHLINVVKEAVNNAVKHASCSVIKLSLHCIRNKKNELQLHIHIEDDGMGFNPEQVKSKNRNGLKSMQSRIEAIGGQFLLKSSAGEGTTISISCTM